MAVVLCWFGLVALIAPGQPEAAATHRDANSPRVVARLSPGPYLVGQAVTVDVVGVAGVVEPPQIPQADWIAVDLAPTLPAAPAILSRFLLVPRRAGELVVPPIRVGVGEHEVRSSPLRLTVANVPLAGRTAAFLGGVGAFEVASEVEPRVVRAGQPVEFRLIIRGPAAAGSNGTPDLASWAQLPASFRVGAAASQLDRSNPPTRTIRYRLRPMKPGPVTLPPLAVAAFDPGARRYSTRYTRSLVVDVTAPPRFDAVQVNYQPLPRTPRRSLRALILAATAVVSGVAAIGGFAAWRWTVRRRAERRVDWQRAATELQRWAGGELGGIEVAKAVADRFTDAITRATGQPVAVLTPPDAEAAVLALSGVAELARRAGDLVATCDRFRFDPNADTTAGDRGELVAEAVAVFEAIGHLAREERKPRQRTEPSTNRAPGR